MTSVSPSGTARETSETRRAFERLVNSNDLRDEASADVDNVDTDAGAASEVGERGVRCAMNDACRRGYGDRNGTVRSPDQDAGRTIIDADDRARNDRMGTRTGVLMRVVLLIAGAVPMAVRPLRRIGERVRACAGQKGRTEQDRRKRTKYSHIRLINANANRLVPFAA